MILPVYLHFLEAFCEIMLDSHYVNLYVYILTISDCKYTCNWLFTLQYKKIYNYITKNIVSMLKLSSGVFVLFTLTTSWKPHYNFKSYAYFIWQLLVYEIQYGKDERAYLTQGGETGYKNDVLQINGIYATKLGIKEEDVCILNKYWYKMKHCYICFLLIRVTAVLEGSCCWYNTPWSWLVV